MIRGVAELRGGNGSRIAIVDGIMAVVSKVEKV